MIVDVLASIAPELDAASLTSVELRQQLDLD
jgi:hypothetical protein